VFQKIIYLLKEAVVYLLILIFISVIIYYGWILLGGSWFNNNIDVEVIHLVEREKSWGVSEKIDYTNYWNNKFINNLSLINYREDIKLNLLNYILESEKKKLIQKANQCYLNLVHNYLNLLNDKDYIDYEQFEYLYNTDEM